MPILILNQSTAMPLLVRAPSNGSTSNVPCQYWYWTKVQICQYRYLHHFMPVPVIYRANTGSGPTCINAITGTGPSNGSTGNVPCQYWYLTKMHKCQYRYWHYLMPVPVMYRADTGTGPKCLNAITGTGTM
jgi:hypothetical protein